MAKVQLKIEVNPNAETEKLGDITNKVDGTGTNANLSNVSIKANDRGLYKVGEMNSKGRELLSFGEDGNLVFTQSGYLSSNGKDLGMLASEQNPDMFVWGVVPSNKAYNVKLTFTNAQNLKDIVVYGDRVANQFPTEAIIDNNKVIYNDDYRWAINLLTESDTHTIEFTKWNRGDYNACLTLIRVMLRYFDISKDSGLIEVESLSQSNSQPKDIYYGVIPNTGSARVNDIGGEIKDLIDEGIITNSRNNIEIFIDSKKVQHHITTDSDYKDGKVFTMEFENSLSFLETKYAGRNLTDPMSAYELLVEVLGTLSFNREQVNTMLDKEIVYGDNEIGSVKSYLEKITIEYPYLESATYRETLDKFCTLAQLNLLEDDNGNLKFVSARPVEPKTTDIISIPINRQFSSFSKDEFLKNKYTKPFVGYSKFNVETGLFGEIKNASYIEDSGELRKGEFTTNWGTILNPDYSVYTKTYNNENKNSLAKQTIKIARGGTEYYKTTLRLSMPKDVMIKNIDELKLSISGNRVGTTQITYDNDDPNVDIPLYKSITYRPYKTSEFNVLMELKSGQTFKNIIIENVDKQKEYIELDIYFPVFDGGTKIITTMEEFEKIYVTAVNFQLYGTTHKYSSVDNENISDIEIRGNELIQEKTLYDNNKKVYELNKTNIIVDYTKGIKTGKISVGCLDYYDTHGNKAIDWSKQQIMQVGQVVRIDKDNLGNSKVNYINGDPYLWKITGRNFRYSGVPMLDLELQECKLNTYFLINENLPEYVVASYTRISSDYGGELGEIGKNDILYPNDTIKVTYTMVDNPIYELGNGYVNGTKISSGDIITIEDNLDLVVETSFKKFTISADIETGATLILNRISSPLANATLGNVNANDSFYYGDVIDISWDVETGYDATALLNGKKIYSFNLNQITINSNNNIKIITQVVGWYTMFEGDFTYYFENKNEENEVAFPVDLKVANTRFTIEWLHMDVGNGFAEKVSTSFYGYDRQAIYCPEVFNGNFYDREQPQITFDFTNQDPEHISKWLKIIRTQGVVDGYDCIVDGFKITKIEQYY